MQQPNAEQLVVRQHERYLCRLGCQVRVAEQSAEQIVLARNVGDGSGGLDTAIVDCSRGGLGLESSVFLPRGCRLKVKLPGSTPAKPLELLVRVQRATMQDRAPTYYLGVSFAGSGDEHLATVEQVLQLARANPAGKKEAA